MNRVEHDFYQEVKKYPLEIQEILIQEFKDHNGCINFGGYSELTDISILRHFEWVTILMLYNTSVSDISILDALPDLHQLDLEGTQVTDISVLSKINNLGILDLEDTKVSDIRPLLNKSSLTWLNLTFTQVKNRMIVNNLMSKGVKVFGFYPDND
jgi:Leucine-rich repeat (LRR) protein